jgi:Flp pilus assembly pilin Flp
MIAVLKKFVTDQRGTETVEWGIMAGLIVAGLVTTVGLIGTWVHTKFTGLKSDLGA